MKLNIQRSWLILTVCILAFIGFLEVQPNHDDHAIFRWAFHELFNGGLYTDHKGYYYSPIFLIPFWPIYNFWNLQVVGVLCCYIYNINNMKEHKSIYPIILFSAVLDLLPGNINSYLTTIMIYGIKRNDKFGAIIVGLCSFKPNVVITFPFIFSKQNYFQGIIIGMLITWLPLLLFTNPFSYLEYILYNLERQPVIIEFKIPYILGFFSSWFYVGLNKHHRQSKTRIFFYNQDSMKMPKIKNY